jgi:pimeloyl-ACP methyl ester carboxylesterase
MAPTSGILYVTMQPSSDLLEAQFHDWYNNEHGPTRLRLPFIENGFRYRAMDLETPGAGTSDMPEWMATYDVTDMEELTRETYTRLREKGVKSQREKDVMAQIKVGRKLYDLFGERKTEGFEKLEDISVGEREGNVLVAVSLTLKEGKDGKELDRWYDEEHIDMLSKVSGWQRTRRFVTSSILGGKEGIEYLALHEYAPKNGLIGDEFKAATSTSWASEVMTNVVQVKNRRVYELYYTFGAAPRHLSDISAFNSPDGQTATVPKSQSEGGIIESYITTEDGVVLLYRLEGSSDPNAPCVVLSNSILVDWGIWDGFIASFFSPFPENRRYRILRYLTRGRSSSCGEQAITVDLLASDIIALLDALRIPKAAALIGVSLGGATVLNTSLRHPERVASFISCDTSSKSPEGNRRTWGERTLIAERAGAKSETNERTVGEQLAEMTVRRWFFSKSYDGGQIEKQIEKVKSMVASNSLEGFKKSVEALFEYDLRDEMKRSQVRGMFLVGSEDGALPDAMKETAKAHGGGAEFAVIDEAGHLPMVEKPQQFADIVTMFLSGTPYLGPKIV